MKDCAKCPHSVSNNPTMRGVEWEKTPCYTCTAQNPCMGVPLSFEPEAREDVVNEVVSHENETISMQQMVSILRDWQLLTTREQRILIYRLDNPCETQRRTAEYFGISQQQYARHKSKITTVFPFVKAKM